MLSVFMCVYQILFSSLNVMLAVDKHCSDVCCDKFPVPNTDHKSNDVKEHNGTENFICNQYEEKRAVLDT